MTIFPTRSFVPTGQFAQSPCRPWTKRMVSTSAVPERSEGPVLC